jgi:Phage protein
MGKARRFDAMCRQLGFTRALAAKTLQVSERTLHNWVSGKTAVPYAAYKLLRVLCFHEIPFVGWDGWHFAGGKLWSPEGHAFTGKDSSWWSLLVRQARSVGLVFDQQREHKATIARLRDELAAYRAELATHEDADGSSRSLSPVPMGGVLATPHQSFTDERKPPFCYKS